MNNFIIQLKQLLKDFDSSKCNNSCNDCELNKILLEFDGGSYSQYDACDLLDMIKDSLKL